jgi:biotin synthase
MAGAGSIFAGDKLLTTPNPEFNEDKEMFDILGLVPKEPFKDGVQPVSMPDAQIEARKRKEEEREAELKLARENAIQEGFEPRKVTSVESL